jgi:hypothetical protein
MGWDPRSSVPPPPPPASDQTTIGSDATTPGGATSGGPPSGSQPSGPPPGSRPPSDWPSPTSRPPRSTRRRAVLAGAAVVVVVVGGVVGVALAGGGTNNNGNAVTTTTGPAPSPVSPTTGVHATAIPVGSLTSLDRLVPSDDQDPTTCSPYELTAPSDQVNIVSNVRCADPDLRAYVYAVQFKTASAYQAGVNHFNLSASFNPSGAEASCPPSNSPQGEVTYSFTNYPARPGQVLECFVNTSGYTYAWTLPSQNTLLWTTVTNYTSLESWWSAQSADPDS